MQQRSLMIIFLLILSFACKKEEGKSLFNEAYLGSFNCTKSSISFSDDSRTREIELLLEKHENRDSVILVNGVPLPLKSDGTTGRISVEGDIYDLEIRKDSLFLFTHPDAIGFFKYCYIKCALN